MNVYILQHGEAEPKEIDPERPLSEQGIRDIAAVALHLHNAAVQLGTICHSGKLRAEQSARCIAETLSAEIEPAHSKGLNPNDDPKVFAGRIDQMSGDALIVSHMPFVSRLCSTLLTGTTEAEFASLPGTLFCLDNSDGQWRLLYMLRPS